MTIRIKVRQNGAYAIDLATTVVELVDHEDNPIPIPEGKKVLALCRCGESKTMPICDGSHKLVQWNGTRRASAAELAESAGVDEAARPLPGETATG